MKTLKLILFLITIVAMLAVLAILNPVFAATAVDASSRENTTWFILSVTLIVLFSIA